MFFSWDYVSLSEDKCPKLAGCGSNLNLSQLKTSSIWYRVRARVDSHSQTWRSYYDMVWSWWFIFAMVWSWQDHAMVAMFFQLGRGIDSRTPKTSQQYEFESHFVPKLSSQKFVSAPERELPENLWWCLKMHQGTCPVFEEIRSFFWKMEVAFGKMPVFANEITSVFENFSGSASKYILHAAHVCWMKETKVI